MKKLILFLLAVIISVPNCYSQSNSYNMVIELSNGTKLNLGPNDVSSITFLDGELVLNGGKIEDIIKKQQDFEGRIEKLESDIQKQSKDIATLKNGSGNEGTVPLEAKKFVGFWRNKVVNQNYYRHFAFYPDGTCISYNVDSWASEKGVWSYDATSKILATTCGGWQFQVTVFTDSEWAGVSLGSSGVTQSFYRDDDTFAHRLIVSTEWTYEDQIIKFGSDKGYFIFSWTELAPPENSSVRHYDQDYRRCHLSNLVISGDELTADYRIEDAYYQLGRNDYKNYFYYDVEKGTLKIQNLYDAHATLIMSSKPDHVYVKKQE